MAGQTTTDQLVRAGGRVGDPAGGLSSLLASQTLRAVVDLREPPGAGTEEAEAVVPAEPEDPERPLAGRLAVVTGAGAGLGRLVALALVDAGARVGVLDRDGDALAETAAAAEPDAPIVPLECDLGSLSDVEGAADFIARLDRPVHVLVHAASCPVTHGLEGEVSDLDEQYLVNLRGPYALTQLLLPQLRSAPGHVVFLGTDGEPAREELQHAMTRAGVEVLAAGLRRELAPAGGRVSVVRDAGPDTEPADVAACVLGALEMPRRLEVSDVRLRAAASA